MKTGGGGDKKKIQNRNEYPLEFHNSRFENFLT